MNDVEHFDPDEAVRRMNGIEDFDPAKTSLRNGPASVQTRLEEARQQCRLALGALEATEEFGLCAEVAEAEGTLDDVLDAIEEIEEGER